MSDTPENDDINIGVVFTGNPSDEVYYHQKGYGLVPEIAVRVDRDGDDVTFVIDSYGTDEYQELLECVIEALQSVVAQLVSKDQEGDDEE